MADSFHCTIKVTGVSEHAEAARHHAEAAFGPCVPDEHNPFLETENPPPLAVVRLEPVKASPPVMLAQELSAKLPEVTVTLLYWSPLGGVRGHRSYVAGAVTDDRHETFIPEEEYGAMRSVGQREPGERVGEVQGEEAGEVEAGGTVPIGVAHLPDHSATIARVNAAMAARRMLDGEGVQPAPPP